MNKKEKISIIRVSSESFILQTLSAFYNNPDFIKLILAALKLANYSFAGNKGKLLHYAIQHHHTELFTDLINLANFSPKVFTVTNSSKQTVLEAVINSLPAIYFERDSVEPNSSEKNKAYQRMEMLFVMLDKLPETLRKQILLMKSRHGNYTLLDLAKKIGHQKLIERLQVLQPESKEEKYSGKKQPIVKKHKKTKKQLRKELFQQAAPRGLNFIAEANNSIKQDPIKARKLYEESALKYNNSKAKRLLAHCYLLGIGGSKDPIQAFALYEKAAESDIPAKCYLAACYLLGVGTEANKDLAEKYMLETNLVGGFVSSFRRDLELFFAEDKTFYEKMCTEIIDKLPTLLDKAASEKQRKLKEIIKEEPKITSEEKEVKTSPFSASLFGYSSLQVRALPYHPKNNTKQHQESDKKTEADLATLQFPPFKYDPKYPQLNKLLKQLQMADGLKEPSKMANLALVIKIKNSIARNKVIPELYDFICKKQVGLSKHNVSFIITKLRDIGLSMYAIEFFRIVAESKDLRLIDAPVISSIISAAIEANNSEFINEIYRIIKQPKYKHLIDTYVLSAMIRATMINNDYDLAKEIYLWSKSIGLFDQNVSSAIMLAASLAGDYPLVIEVYEFSEREHFVNEFVSAIIIKAATFANDDNMVEKAYELARKLKIDNEHVQRAYLSFLAKKYKNPDADKSKLIDAVYEKCIPLKEIASGKDKGKINLHTQNYGSTFIGLKKILLTAKRPIQLQLIVGKGLHTKFKENEEHTKIMQAILDLCSELGCKWERYINSTGCGKLSYTPGIRHEMKAVSSLPQESKLSNPVEKKTSLQRAKSHSQFSLLQPKAESKTAIVIPLVELARPTKEKVQAIKNNLAALHLLVNPSKIPLEIVNTFLNEILPNKENILELKGKLPAHIKESLDSLKHILNQCSSGFVLLKGSIVLFLINNIIRKALGLPEEKFKAKVELVVERKKTNFEMANKRCDTRFSAELKTTPIPYLHKITINGVVYTCFESKELAAGKMDLTKESDFTVDSLLAIMDENDNFTASIPHQVFVDAALRVVSTHGLQSTRQWVEGYTKGSPERVLLVDKLFRLLEKHIHDGLRINDIEVEELISIFPVIEICLCDPVVVEYVLEQMKKFILQGHTEKFHQVCSAYDVMKVFFPFVRSITEPMDKQYIAELMQSTDDLNKQKDLSKPSPSLHKIAARMLALTMAHENVDIRVRKMQEVINRDLVLKQLFDEIGSDYSFELHAAISDVETYRRNQAILASHRMPAGPVPTESESPASHPNSSESIPPKIEIVERNVSPHRQLAIHHPCEEKIRDAQLGSPLEACVLYLLRTRI